MQLKTRHDLLNQNNQLGRRFYWAYGLEIVKLFLYANWVYAEKAQAQMAYLLFSINKPAPEILKS